MPAAIYGQTPPLVNASRKPGQWQTYDVVFTAPRFDGDKLLEPAYFTVFWNGVLVQYRTACMGTTDTRPCRSTIVTTWSARSNCNSTGRRFGSATSGCGRFN